MIFFERWPCQRIDLQREWNPAVSWLRITKRQSMVIGVTVKPKRKDRRTKCGEFIFGVETPVCVSPADQRLSRRSPPRRYAYPFPICVLPTVFDRILFLPDTGTSFVFFVIFRINPVDNDGFNERWFDSWIKK